MLSLSIEPSKLNKQLLIAGILFSIHNLEEAIGFAYFTYPKDFPIPIEPPSKISMIWSIVLITLIAWGLIIWTSKQDNKNIKRNILTIFVIVFLINACFPHIAGAIAVKGYFPALVTSVLLYLPYSYLLIPKLFDSYPLKKQFFTVVLTGIFLSFILVLVLQTLTKYFFE